MNNNDFITALDSPKSNRFVSKHTAFGGKKLEVEPKILDSQELKRIVDKIKKSQYDTLLKRASKYKSLEEFLKDKFIAPRPDLVPIQKLPKVVCMTVPCLPPKNSNPLKCDNSKDPDLGEFALLIHFEQLAKVINQVFDSHIFKFKIICEAKMYGILLNERESVCEKFNRKLQSFYLNFIDKNLVELVDWREDLLKLKNFDITFKKELKSIRKELNRDAQLKEELLLIFPTTYMSTKSSSDNYEKIYLNYKVLDDEVIEHINKSKNIAIRIMAFNHTRKLLCEKEILYANDFKGTITPGPDRYNFFSIDKDNKLYSHHGVGIFDTKRNRVQVEYASNLIQTDSSDYISAKII